MSGAIRYTSQSGRPHRAAKSAARQDDPIAPSKPTPARDVHVPDRLPPQRNVRSVLSLGATRYMTIGRLGTFCCPPVPFRLGQKGMDLYVNMMNAAREVVRTGSNESKEEYYQYMREMATLLHHHIRPVGFLLRKMWRVRMTRNQFLNCSEQEIKDLADFFLQGRMKSNVQSTLESEEALA